MTSNSSKNIKAGVVITYITQFLGIFISFFYIPIMLRMLGQTEYGLYALVQSIVSYLQMSEMGIGITATRYNARYIALGDTEGQKSINGMFRLLYLGIATFCLVIGFVVYNFIPSWYDHYNDDSIALIRKLFLLALANLIINLIFKIYNAVIVAYEKFIFQKMLRLITTILGPVGMLAVLYLGHRSIGMVCVTTTITFLSGLTEFLYCKLKLKVKFKYGNFPKGMFATIFSFTAFVFVNSIAHQLFSNSDKIIISLLLTESAVAVYAIVVQFQVYFYNFANVISGFYLPRFSKSVSKVGKVSDQLMEDIINTSRIQLFIAGLIFGGFTAIGRSFIVRWVGADYEPAYFLTVLVLGAEFMGSPQSMFNSLMQAMNLHKGRALISLSCAVVKIGIVVFMVYEWGLVGSALGYLFMYLFRLVVYNIYYRRVGINIRYFWSKIIGPMTQVSALIGTLYFVIFALTKVLPANTYGMILIYVLIYLGCFILIGWMFILSDYEKALLKSTVSKISRIWKRR